MVEFPIDKYLAQDYRDTLRTFDSPQNIETKNPIIPVIDIQKGFIKPNSKQKLCNAFVYAGATTTRVQLATASTSLKVYFVAMQSINFAANVGDTILFDAISGNAPTTTAGNVYTGVDAPTCRHYLPASGNLTTTPTIPVQVTNGLRVEFGGTSQNYYVMIWWIEEIV